MYAIRWLSSRRVSPVWGRCVRPTHGSNLREGQMRRIFAVITITVTSCALSYADTRTFTASQGNLAASAEFEDLGANLIVTLTNTSTFDVLVPADVMTALFFDVDGAPLNLTPVSAVLGAGSTVLFGGSDPGGVVGGEWEWEESFVNPAPHGADYGIGSSGFQLFGAGEMFPGTNLQGPANVDGLQYGLVSGGDNPATGNSPVTGDNALIKNEVVFTLSGLPAGFDVDSITNVSWQYGTSLDEPNIPEPSSLLLLSAMGVSAFRRRR